MKQQTSATTETKVKVTKIDFSGRTIYVGIDVHKKDWQVAAVLGELVLGNHRMTGDAQKIIDHLSKGYPGAKFKCVYESCAWGFGLQRKLTKAGMECIVVHAADVSGSDKERRRKTDKVDAVKLARHHAAGLLKGIHVPDEQLQRHRSLIRFRNSLVGDLTRDKNRMKALFKLHGIEVPAHFDNSSWSANFLEWIEQQAAKEKDLTDVILLMLKKVRQDRTLLLETQKKLRELSRHGRYQQQVDLLASTPGIGTINSMLFALEIGDVRRFRTFDQLADFVGLCPDSHSSGETERHTSITSRRHRKLRANLIEASWQAVRRDPALLQSFEELSKRMPKNKAIIRIARKLLRRMRRVLLTGIAYQKGVVA